MRQGGPAAAVFRRPVEDFSDLQTIELRKRVLSKKGERRLNDSGSMPVGLVPVIRDEADQVTFAHKLRRSAGMFQNPLR
jgi:hypothetical protein